MKEYIEITYIIIHMFFAIENKEEFINFIKNANIGENKTMRLILNYTVEKKSNILVCIPIIQDLQDIVSSYYTKDVIIECNCYAYNSEWKFVNVIFEDAEVRFVPPNITNYFGDFDKYKNEINAICTIVNTVFNL